MNNFYEPCNSYHLSLMLNVVIPIGGMAMQQTWQKLVGTLNSLATLPK